MFVLCAMLHPGVGRWNGYGEVGEREEGAADSSAAGEQSSR